MRAHQPEPMPVVFGSPPAAPAATRRRDDLVPERFYRDLISGMRNGVIVIRRDGALVAINDAAYASLDMLPGAADIGCPIATVLADVPEMVRVLDGAFGSDPLPNRAEVKLARTGRSIGFTLSLVRDGLGDVSGAALFFRDLTRVEQLEERERLRDRLAALGEMAAAIAHEVKNPLAGIEVMAGLLKRRLSDNPEAQAMLADIIGEAKMANAIVIEVLDFVRPVRLQVEDVEVGPLVQDSLHMADSQVPRGNVAVSVDVPEDLPPVQGDGHQLRQVFTNLLTNAFEALSGEGRLIIRATALAHLPFPATPDQPQGPGVEITVHRRWARHPGVDARAHLQPVLHDQAPRLRPRPGHRAQGRGCPRRPHRRPAWPRRDGHGVSARAAAGAFPRACPRRTQRRRRTRRATATVTLDA